MFKSLLCKFIFSMKINKFLAYTAFDITPNSTTPFNLPLIKYFFDIIHQILTADKTVIYTNIFNLSIISRFYC